MLNIVVIALIVLLSSFLIIWINRSDSLHIVMDKLSSPGQVTGRQPVSSSVAVVGMKHKVHFSGIKHAGLTKTPWGW